MSSKIAVVLLNLGGPAQEADIAPFLFNFFMDKNIISAPLPLRYLIAKWIAYSRSRGAALTAYTHLGGKSPLLQNTQAQAAALEKLLRARGIEAKVFVSMRYWQPMAAAVALQVQEYQPDQIILLPLYPQYSTTTTGSSFQNWQAVADQIGLKTPTAKICGYPDHAGFIKASAVLIQNEIKIAPARVRLLFSAHGLPEKIIKAGDPYQAQCEQTAAAIVAELGIVGLDWQICYQSRVGRLKWITPSTEDALEQAASDRMSVVIYPLAFVSEHIETLVEIDIEYRERAKAMGIPYFGRVPTVGTHPLFIEGLADLILAEEIVR
jgi:ferrochelatase